MLIGDKQVFAIECVHEPIPNPTRRVFGRMCIWSAGHRLGNLQEPSCNLNVTEGYLQGVLARLDSLWDSSLDGLGPGEGFQLLDNALYRGTNNETVAADYERYSKFDFLTNGGESFNNTRSFLMTIRDIVRLLYTDEMDVFHAADIPRRTFTTVIQEFLVWVSDEAARAA
jgi:hypothetical protein